MSNKLLYLSLFGTTYVEIREREREYVFVRVCVAVSGTDIFNEKAVR